MHGWAIEARASRRQLLAVLMATILGSCGKPLLWTPKPTPEQNFETYFVHGDPLQLIAGASLSKEPVITLANLDDFRRFNFAAGTFFLTRRQLASGQVKESLEPDTAELIKRATMGRGAVSNIFDFVQQGDGNYAMCSLEGCKKLIFDFSVTGTGLHLSGIRFGHEGFEQRLEVQPLHESSSSDGEAFSVLAETSSPQTGRALLALYFTKQVEQAVLPAETDRKYSYLYGPGNPTPWKGAVDEPIHVDICGTPSEDMAAALREGVEAWVKDGHVGRRRLILGESKQAYPFTDLEQHCLSVVDDYFFESTHDLATLGITISVVNPSTRRIVDSDIFISRKGLKKAYRAFWAKHVRSTAMHEFGHFLGLDHEFSRDASGNLLHPSIMGDDDAISEVTPHDAAAIHYLYGGGANLPAH